MTEIRELLDQLDQAHAAATRGPWAQNGADPAYVIGQVSEDGEEYVDVADTAASAAPFGWKRAEADAALIVAAVNALPELIRLAREREALREKMETVAAWCEEQAASRSHFAKVDPAYRNTVIPYEATAERLRDALTAALSPAEVTR